MSGKSNCILASAVLCSPVGNYAVEACESGIHSVNFERGVSNDNFETKGRREVRILRGSTKHIVLVKFAEWLANYFLKKVDSDVPICRKVADPDSGAFREKVWLTLKENVKFGETVTYERYNLIATSPRVCNVLLPFSTLRYGELASLAGKPGTARAVGSAMSNNPVCLLVPCHRVVPASGGKLIKIVQTPQSLATALCVI